VLQNPSNKNKNRQKLITTHAKTTTTCKRCYSFFLFFFVIRGDQEKQKHCSRGTNSNVGTVPSNGLTKHIESEGIGTHLNSRKERQENKGSEKQRSCSWSVSLREQQLVWKRGKERSANLRGQVFRFADALEATALADTSPFDCSRGFDICCTTNLFNVCRPGPDALTQITRSCQTSHLCST